MDDNPIIFSIVWAAVTGLFIYWVANDFDTLATKRGLQRIVHKFPDESEVRERINSDTDTMLSVYTNCTVSLSKHFVYVDGIFTPCDPDPQQAFNNLYQEIKNIVYTKKQEKALADWWVDWSTTLYQTNAHEQSLGNL
jgi:hypothetical protein